VSDAGYLLAVKPSARRVSARAGQWVNHRGTVRRFESKPLAREWARACSTGAATVWVQDAPSWADDDADGYLVGRRFRTAPDGRTGRQATIGEADR